MNCEAFPNFNWVSFGHIIVPTTIILNLHQNKKQTAKFIRYDWKTLRSIDTNNRYAVIVRKRFDILEETSETFIPNDKYEHFVNIYINTAAEYIATKPKAKCYVLSESNGIH